MIYGKERNGISSNSLMSCCLVFLSENRWLSIQFASTCLYIDLFFFFLVFSLLVPTPNSQILELFQLFVQIVDVNQFFTVFKVVAIVDVDELILELVWRVTFDQIDFHIGFVTRITYFFFDEVDCDFIGVWYYYRFEAN